MTGKEILNIRDPRVLFQRHEIKRQFRGLCKQWHPDVNKGVNANNVFRHVLFLYEQAVEIIRGGIWDDDLEVRVLLNRSGKRGRVKYERYLEFEKLLVYQRGIVGLLELQYKQLIDDTGIVAGVIDSVMAVVNELTADYKGKSEILEKMMPKPFYF